MANDRIILRCKRCKKDKVIYKHYPSGGYATDNIGEFIDEHLRECQQRFDTDLGCDAGFELHTEHTYIEAPACPTA